jgi:hypothetical protein
MSNWSRLQGTRLGNVPVWLLPIACRPILRILSGGDHLPQISEDVNCEENLVQPLVAVQFLELDINLDMLYSHLLAYLHEPRRMNVNEFVIHPLKRKD